MTFTRTFKPGDRVRLGERVGSFRRIAGGGRNEVVVEWDDGEMAGCAFDDLRHAPVTVVGPTPAPLAQVCPECGGHLMLDAAALADGVRRVRLLACCGCEYAVEV